MNQFMIIKNQYVILTIVVGVCLVLLTSISYLAVWQKRLSRDHWVTQSSSWKEVFASIPWILVITYVGISVMAIVTIIYYAIKYPNW